MLLLHKNKCFGPLEEHKFKYCIFQKKYLAHLVLKYAFANIGNCREQAKSAFFSPLNQY